MIFALRPAAASRVVMWIFCKCEARPEARLWSGSGGCLAFYLWLCSSGGAGKHAVLGNCNLTTGWAHHTAPPLLLPLCRETFH